MSSNRHPFDGPEVFDDYVPQEWTDEEVLRELEPYPVTAAAVRSLRAARAN